LRTEFNQSQDLSGARCYSCTLTATAITACVVTICAANLTYLLAAIKTVLPGSELYHFAEKAQNAFFYCESYAESMARADANSVVYCDPPYAPLSATANFTAYHTNSFTLEQQAHLAAIARAL
jgi:DNA adenine methylase